MATAEPTAKSGWEVKTLGEVCEMIKRGIAPKYSDEGGLCVINQKCVRDHLIDFSLSRRHDFEKKKVPEERIVKKGDVLVNSTGVGTLGRVAQIREETEEAATVDTHVTIVRPIPGKFYLDFFGYMLVMIEEEIKTSGEGASGQTELARKTLSEKFHVKYPNSLAEQERIVGILDEAFEGIAAATAQAEKNLHNARELFQSVLQSTFSQKGDDWVEMTLEEVCEFQGGSQPPKSTFSSVPKDGYVRLIQIRDYKTDDKKVFVDKDSVRRFCTSEDVMIGRYGPPVFQILKGIEGAYNVALMKAIPNPNFLNREFTFHRLKAPDIQNYIVGLSERAAGQTGVNKADLHAFEILVPPLAEQDHIVEKLDALSEETKRLEAIYERKQSTLTELKQSLLQKAFAGEL